MSASPSTDSSAAPAVLLHVLEAKHPLRTKPLGEIGAQVRNLQQAAWRDLASWYIARVSFNQLGEAWTETNEFRAGPITPTP